MPYKAKSLFIMRYGLTTPDDVFYTYMEYFVKCLKVFDWQRVVSVIYNVTMVSALQTDGPIYCHDNHQAKASMHGLVLEVDAIDYNWSTKVLIHSI